MSLITELNRRNVFRAAIAYAVGCWLLVEIGDVVLGTFGAPDWVLKTLIALLLLGLPIVVFFSWVYEVTPEGLRRESEVERDHSITHLTRHKLDRALVVLLVVALAYFAVDKFVLAPGREAEMLDASARTAAESVDAPAREQSVSPAQSDKSIAVLPFVDMSPESDQGYFSDGLSEELLNLLAKIPDLRVAARTSSFSFKGQNLQIPEIAHRLNVATVLEGSVRKAGNQVRITAQLVKADDGFHLWSETYDRTLDNIFAIQGEIAAAVVDELKVKLLGAVPAAVETDPEAYALYLQARQVGRQSSNESLERSNDLYRQALEMDPRYAAAWDGLATNLLQQVTTGGDSQAALLEPLRQAVDTALAIDPQYASAYATLGQIASDFDRDLTTAAHEIERAVALEPGNIEILRAVIVMYRVLGRVEEALPVAKHMVRLDPVNNHAWYNLGLINRYLGNHDQAIAALERAVSLSPERTAAWNLIAESLMLKGDPQGALQAIANEKSPWRVITLPMVYYALGRQAESDAALEKLIREQSEQAAYNIAYNYAYRGEADLAFEWLERAIETNDPGLGDLPVEILFANIHDDPRWLPFLERLGNAPAQLDAIEFEVRLPD